MRVILICNEFPPAAHGGIGSSAFDLATALHEAGIGVEVVGVVSPGYLEYFSLSAVDERYGFPVFRLTGATARLPFTARVLGDRWTLFRWLQARQRKNHPDLVFADDYDGMLPFGTPGSVPLVVRLNGSNFVYDSLLARGGQRLVWWCERRTLGEAAGWIGVSRFFLNETLARLPKPEGTIATVLPNPVDTGLFSPASPDDLSVPGRIVFHNTLHRRKGLFDLFEALPAVFREIPEAHLEIYGGNARLAETRGDLMSRIPPELAPRISFLGRIDRYSALPAALERARVACYPSHLETFGIAPIEAMSMKRVTIYSDCGPGNEIVTHGRDGFLCPPKDPAALASTLIRALTLPDADRLAMGEAARHTAVSRFDKKVVTRAYIGLFRRILGIAGDDGPEKDRSRPQR